MRQVLWHRLNLDTAVEVLRDAESGQTGSAEVEKFSPKQFSLLAASSVAVIIVIIMRAASSCAFRRGLMCAFGGPADRCRPLDDLVQLTVIEPRALGLGAIIDFDKLGPYHRCMQNRSLHNRRPSIPGARGNMLPRDLAVGTGQTAGRSLISDILPVQRLRLKSRFPQTRKAIGVPERIANTPAKLQTFSTPKVAAGNLAHQLVPKSPRGVGLSTGRQKADTENCP